MDSSNEAEVKKAQAEDEDRAKDIDFVMSQPRGRRFMYDLIYAACHVDNASFVPGNHEATIFNEGGRAIGSSMRELVKGRNHKLFMKMLEENAQ